MKKYALRTLVFVPSLAILGCSTLGIESKKIEYKSANKAPTLEIPPDLVTTTRNDRFAVPDTEGTGKAKFSDYANERNPETLALRNNEVLPNIDKTRIERSGGQRWLVVSGTAEKVWETVKTFWQENGLLLKLELPDAGVMETDWAENRAKLPQDFIRNTLGKLLDSLYSTGERDKFRTRLEPGTEPGTIEIYISHRGMVEKIVGKTEDLQTRWEPRPADPELEAEMLRRLMVRFGTEEKRATTALAANQAKTQERAKLAKASDGSSALEIQDPFDRAWRRIGLALDRVGFTVEDRDRSKGIYFVRYVDPEADNKKDEGWLTKLNIFSSQEKTTVGKLQYRIQVLDTTPTLVKILVADGTVDQSDTAKKILSLLYEQLR